MKQLATKTSARNGNVDLTSNWARIGQENITIVTFEGVTKSEGNAINFLKTWDSYFRYNMTRNYEEEEARISAKHYNVSQWHGSPRILVGVFTHNLSQLEKTRRQVIRDTYLQSFARSSTPNRICQLRQLLDKTIDAEECQFAYAFVFGGNIGPPIRLDATLEEIELKDDNSEEEDAIYLNIRENSKDGKSETWLYYFTLLQELVYFDFVGKIDTDTVLLPEKFLRRLNTSPKFPENARVYGGRPIIKTDGMNSSLIGPCYMVVSSIGCLLILLDLLP